MSRFTAADREAMQENFRRLLMDRYTEADLRRSMASPLGYDPLVWRRISEMGIVGLIIDPDHGGIGASAIELELIMEEAGSCLLATPLLSSAVLAASLLSNSTDQAAKARLLPLIASGDKIAAVAVAGDQGRWTVDDVGVTAAPNGDGWKLSGVASFVFYGATADILLVVAHAPDGLATFEVVPGVPGLIVKKLNTYDLTQRMARLAFTGTLATRIDGAGASAVTAMLDLARVALAGEQAGAARRIFEITIEYIKTRVQFGRPVGSFQALKHMASDLLVEAESAVSAARHAAEMLAANRPEAGIFVNLAAFTCADVFTQISAAAIQMHGGIAFTWEHPAHLYLRRARADAQLFGSSNFHRERYLTALEKAA